MREPTDLCYATTACVIRRFPGPRCACKSDWIWTRLARFCAWHGFESSQGPTCLPLMGGAVNSAHWSARMMRLAGAKPCQGRRA